MISTFKTFTVWFSLLFAFYLELFILTFRHIQVFIIINVVALVYYIRGILSPKMFKVATTLVVTLGM